MVTTRRAGMFGIMPQAVICVLGIITVQNITFATSRRWKGVTGFPTFTTRRRWKGVKGFPQLPGM